MFIVCQKEKPTMRVTFLQLNYNYWDFYKYADHKNSSNISSPQCLHSEVN